MSGFELNKIAAAVLLAGIIAMISGFFAEALYEPETPEKRGYEVAVESSAPTGSPGVAAPAPLDIAALMAKADAAAGAASAKKCAACHTFEKGEPNKIGPNLAGIVGNKKAHMADFAYSEAMRSSPGSWTEDELAHFIQNPKKHVPGTKMSFAGVGKPEEIANIIAFLKTQK